MPTLFMFILMLAWLNIFSPIGAVRVCKEPILKASIDTRPTSFLFLPMG